MQKPHAWMLGILFFVMLFVLADGVKLLAETTLFKVRILNAMPTGSNLRICTDPLAGATCTHESIVYPAVGVDADYFVFADLTDNNGADDITSYQMRFYRQGAGDACTADKNDCYRDIACTKDATLNDTTIRVICPLTIAYWIDPTTATADDYAADYWTAKVVVTDDSATTGSVTNVSDVAEVLALDGFPSSINYGTRDLGTETTAAQAVNVEVFQAGNVDADVMIKADSSEMVCGVPTGYGSIPTANQHFQAYNVNPVGYADSLTTLSTVLQEMNFADDGVNAGGADATSAIRRRVTDVGYNLKGRASFNIKIPDEGVAGICEAYLTTTVFKQSLPGDGG